MSIFNCIGVIASSIQESGGTPPAPTLTPIVQETRYIASSFSANSTYRFIPWAGSLYLNGTSMIDGADNTKMIMPTDAAILKLAVRITSTKYDKNSTYAQVYKNGVATEIDYAYYTDGYHTLNINAILEVESGDEIQIYTASNDSTLQVFAQEVGNFMSMEVYS